MLGFGPIDGAALAAIPPLQPPPPGTPYLKISQPYKTVFEIQSQIRIEGKFTDLLINQLVTPGFVALILEDPSGLVMNISNMPVDVAGIFHYSFVVTKSGTWSYKWQGSGVVAATSVDGTFTVNPSIFIAG